MPITSQGGSGGNELGGVKMINQTILNEKIS